MSMLPEDPAHAHPNWCDRGTCTHSDSLAARGLTEADVPRHLRYAHFATPRTVELDGHGEVKFTFLPWRFTDEPVTDEVQGVDLLAEWSTMLLSVGVPISPTQLAPLAEAVADLRDLVASTTTSHSPAAARAIAALEAFPGLDRYVASAILPLWAGYADLTDADVVVVLEHFRRSSEGGPR